MVKDFEFVWQKAIELCIILLIVFVPIALYIYSIPIFSPAKEIVFEILTVLSLTFWGFRVIEKKSFISFSLSSFQNIPIVCFIFYSCLSVIWSDSYFVSLRELPLFLAGPLLYFVIINNIVFPKSIKMIINTIITMGFLFGLYGIFQYFGLDFAVWKGIQGRQAVSGLFGNVNYFAEFLLPILPLSFALFLNQKKKIKKIGFLLIFLVISGGILFTFTRSTYLGTGIGIIFIIIVMVLNQGKHFIRQNKKIFIVGIIFFFIFILLILIPNPFDKPGSYFNKLKHRISPEKLIEEISGGRRITIWKFTWLMIQDQPWIGSGIGTFKYNSLKYQAKFLSENNHRDIYQYGIAHETHNEYLQFWAELGIIGLVLFLWMMMSYFYQGLKSLTQLNNNELKYIIIGLMGGIIAVLFDGIFGFPLHLPATLLLFWLFMALTQCITRTDRNNKINNNQKSSINISTMEINKYLRIFSYLFVASLTVIVCLYVFGFFVARVYWYWGTQEVDKGNYHKAVDFYEKALHHDPYFGQMYYAIGQILMYEEQDFEQAEKYFLKSRESSDFPKLPESLALVYLRKGELEKAVRELKLAITYQADEKSMFPWYLYLGKTYMSMISYNQAEQAFQQAVKINSNSKEAHFGLAQVNLKLGKRDKALSEFQEIIRLEPDSKEAEFARQVIEQMQKYTNP